MINKRYREVSVKALRKAILDLSDAVFTHQHHCSDIEKEISPKGYTNSPGVFSSMVQWSWPAMRISNRWDSRNGLMKRNASFQIRGRSKTLACVDTRKNSYRMPSVRKQDPEEVAVS